MVFVQGLNTPHPIEGGFFYPQTFFYIATSLFYSICRSETEEKRRDEVVVTSLRSLDEKPSSIDNPLYKLAQPVESDTNTRVNGFDLERMEDLSGFDLEQKDDIALVNDL